MAITEITPDDFDQFCEDALEVAIFHYSEDALEVASGLNKILASYGVELVGVDTNQNSWAFIARAKV